MSRTLRRIAQWTSRLLLALLAVGVLYVGLVTFPSPLFAHKETHGTYRVYSDEAIGTDLVHVIEDLDRRVRAMEHEPPDASQRIYLCGTKKYSFFAFLLRRSPESLAIGLSVANETFVSLDRVRLFADRNRGVLRHTRFEGNLAEVVAHEIAHFNSVRALGYRRHLSQPLWKSEGWAEYQANLATMRADPDYDLVRRVELLLDESHWGGRHGLARSLWESQLLVEYLGTVEGYDLGDLVADEVTESAARESMMAWYREASDTRAVLGQRMQ